MKKNILYFTRTMGLGGTEKVILQLCNNLKSDFNKIIVCSNGGLHEKELLDNEIKHYKIGDIESKNIINIFRNFIKLNKIIRDENIDIIHTHHRMAAFYTTLLRSIYKFKFIHTSHNTFSNKKILTKFSLNKADVIAVGEKVKENLNQYYKIDENKITVIYNGIDEKCDNFEKIPELEIWRSRGYFLIGNIGRLSEQKGMKYFLEAIPKIINKNNKIMFFIVGEGEERKNLEKQANNLGIKDNIVFLGYRKDVIRIISKLDIIVLTSLWEGLPLTPIESFSQRKPVIATDVDGTSEVVINNYNGILIRPKSVDDIEKAINKIVNNNELIERLSKNAYETYVNKFSIYTFIENYRIYYSNI